MHVGPPLRKAGEHRLADPWCVAWRGCMPSPHYPHLLFRNRVAYLSDVKKIPEGTLKYLQGLNIDVLVLDSLFTTVSATGIQPDSGAVVMRSPPPPPPPICANAAQRSHSTHFNLPEALEAAEALSPKRTILTGMTHEVRRPLYRAAPLRPTASHCAVVRAPWLA